MKLGIISIALPPSQSGQSIVLFHLLKKFKTDSYCLITQKNINMYHLHGNCLEKLPAKYYFIQPDNQITQRIIQGLLFLRFERFLNELLKIRKQQIKKILTKESCDIAIGCTGDLLDPPATFLACKEIGIPFVLYTFDYYSHQWINPILRSFAELYESEIVTGAQQIIVPNECMSELYRKKYGICATVIHNPFDLIEYEKKATLHLGKDDLDRKPGEIKIVFTGAIYDAHFDAFHNLITAIKSLENLTIRIHLYTPQSQRRLTENNITGPVVVHKALPATAMPAIQRNADILFLPLSFGSQFPKVIKTSAPGKMGEYLASKRPILVHAPKDSFVSWYFRKYSCGYVVDQDDPEVLAQAIVHLLQDKKLQQELSDNAYIRAKEDFDITIAQQRFIDLMEGKKSR